MCSPRTEFGSAEEHPNRDEVSECESRGWDFFVLPLFLLYNIYTK